MISVHRFSLFLALCTAGAVSIASSRTDTVKLQWPNPPHTTSHNINGAFCEYRNTLSANHFHNGADVGEPDGNPIYPCLDGVVYSLSTTSGDNNYVRVKTNVGGGMWKHISYVHIQPNPALAPGSPVIAAATVLGNVLTGLGHVHLTERELVASENGSGVEINGIRPGGGLTPYVDTYTPVINRPTLQFRIAGTGTLIPGSTLFGNVDITIRVDERNGPGNPGSTQTNNGTYMIGYRILAADSITVLYDPPDSGLRFRFDRKPYDSQVDIAFLAAPYSTTSSHYYRVTSGNGASAVNSSLSVPANSFNTELLPEGSSVLEIFAEDTRGNTDRALFPIAITRKDLVPPARPTLRSVLVDDTTGHLSISWYPNTDSDLHGYRLYRASGHHDTATWQLIASDSILTDTTAQIDISHPGEFLPAGEPLNSLSFRLSAVDTCMPPNESPPSDAYHAGFEWFTFADCGHFTWEPCPHNPPVLIVDGFDRYGGSGSWGQPTHEFVRQLGRLFNIFTPVSSAANEAIADGSVNLRDYRAVFWILGDESTIDHTLTSTEQAKIRQFLEWGGRLFISGSEIGWDLGRTHSASEAGDLSFYNDYLKAALVYDGDSNMRTATGTASSPFPGLTFTFGQTYVEDYPDDIDPVNGSTAFFTYNTYRTGATPRIAGIFYAGGFGASSLPARLVYLAFPFETIGSQLQRETLFGSVLRLFDIINDVPEQQASAVPARWELSQNFPNPFNPSTALLVTVPAQELVTVRIFDLLGRELCTLLHEVKSGGTHTVRWEASEFPSGTYIARLTAGSTIISRKLLLVK